MTKPRHAKRPTVAQMNQAFLARLRECHGSMVEPEAKPDVEPKPGAHDGLVTPVPSKTNLILTATCHASGLTRDVIRGRTAARDVTPWRHVAMYLLRQHTGCSFPWIARVLGYRNHTTILHGVRVVGAGRHCDQLKRVKAEFRKLAPGWFDT